MDANTSTEDSPIVIGSDDEDDDGDVVVVNEEPCDDVIFVSQTTAPPKTSVDVSVIKNSQASDFENSAVDAVVIQDTDKPELTRSVSISTGLRVALTISNDIEEIRHVGTLTVPLDLSSKLRRSLGNSDTESLTDDENKCQTVQSPEAPLTLPVVVKTEDSPALPVNNSDGSVDSLSWQPTSPIPAHSPQSVASSMSTGSPASSTLWTDDDDSDGSESSSNDNCVDSSKPMPPNPAVSYATSNSPNSFLTMPLIISTSCGSSSIATSACSGMTSAALPAMYDITPSDRLDLKPKVSLKRTFSDSVCSSVTFSHSLSIPSFSCDNTLPSTCSNLPTPSCTQLVIPPLPLGTQTTTTYSSRPAVICSADTTRSAFTSVQTLAQSSKNIKMDSNFNSPAFSFRSATSVNNIQLPPKKQPFFRDMDKMAGSVDVQPPVVKTEKKYEFTTDVCIFCMMPLSGLKMSRCVQGHATCGSCLEDKVKLVLTGKVKESIKCMESGCDSYYPMSELKHSLPSMVVDILEEKLDQEYVDYIDNMIIINGSAETKENGTGDGETEPKKQKLASDAKKGDDTQKDSNNSIIAGLPDNWTEVDERVGYSLVSVEAGSEEYVKVALNFHATMEFPKSDIVKISRVQNPILWRYYSVKKLEMVQDSDGHAVDERELFHGTNSSVVDAICRRGFDWRVSGKNGTSFGQGSYFAVEAAYSHQYTDKPVGKLKVRPQFSPFLRRTSLLFAPFNSIPPPAHVGLSGVSLPPPPPLPLPLQSSPAIMQQPNLMSLPNPSINNTVSSSSTTVINMSPRRMQFQLLAPTPVSLPSQVTTSPVSTSLQGTPALTALPNPFSMTSLLRNPEPPAEKKHTRTVFLAKVLVGKYTGGNSAYRKPPPLFPDTDVYGRCYDSCVNDIHNPKIFVVFDTAQAYPNYLLEYHCGEPA
ncbi:hypothetical protein ScPMuIL_015211 [Solemya velum]